MSTVKTTSTETQAYPIEIGGWYRVVRGVIAFLLRCIAKVEVTGLEHVPEQGPYLVITNHLHWLDPPTLMVILPYRGHVFAAEKWEHHWFHGPLMRSLDSIFVQRGEVDRNALRQALAVLKGGSYMGMAPEGTRSKTGGLQQGKGGAAYLAYRANAPLVPAVTWGQEKLFSYLKRLRRVPIRVVVAEPFEAPPVEGRAGTADIHTFTEEIMYRIAAMLPPEYRGVYSDVAEKRPDLLELYADLHNS